MKSRMLKAAIKIAKKSGYKKISNTAIAKEVGCVESLVTFHFKKIENLRNAVIKNAIDESIEQTVAHAIILKEPIVIDFKKLIRQKWPNGITVKI